MFNFSGGNHDKEHERLIRLGRVVPFTTTTLPAATTANTGQRISYNNVDYYSDGTRWLSTTLYSYQMNYMPAVVFPATATATGVMRMGMPDELMSIYITKITIKTNTQTTLDVTNNWTLQFIRFDNANTPNNLGSAINSYAAGRVAGTPYMNAVSINTLYTQAQMTAVLLNVTKNTAPGSLNFEPATVWYRLIAA